MLKRVIKIASFVVSIFFLLLILQYMSLTQQRTPFGTDSQFSLDLSESRIEKDELIEKLNGLSLKYNTTLLKVSVDVNKFQNKKDIIIFGWKNLNFKNPVVKKDEIKWLEGNLKGKLLHTNEIGSRILTGRYAYSYNDGFKNDLTKFVEENNIQINFYEKTSPVKTIYAFFITNGIGNGVMASFLLLISTIIIWFVVNSKARAIRFLGGISRKQIHLEDTREILKHICIGEVVGFLTITMYIVLTRDVGQLGLILSPLIQGILMLGIILGSITLILSLFVSPKPEHITERCLPLKNFMIIGNVNRFVAILIALIVIPTTLNAAIITYKLSNEYSLWSNNSNVVRIAFKDIDPLVTDEMLPETEEFFKTLSNNHNLSLSYVVDKGIELSNKELGKYDHVVVTDKAWLENMKVGIEKQNKNGILNKVAFNQIHEELRNFLNEQLAIWTRSGKVQDEGIEFYEFKGDKFLALPPNVGTGSETIQAKNPLVIVVDNPVKTFKTKGFTLYLASSGNVVFSDIDKLKKVVDSSKIKSCIASIDNTAEIALENAQEFKQQSIAYVIACIIIAVVMIFLSILSGKLWAIQNKKKIFTLHTFGKTYGEILSPVLRTEAIRVLITIMIGGILAYLIHHVSIDILALTVAVIVGLQLLGGVLAYRQFSKQAFMEMSHRN